MMPEIEVRARFPAAGVWSTYINEKINSDRKSKG
jgi:hypothetical protein